MRTYRSRTARPLLLGLLALTLSATLLTACGQGQPLAAVVITSPVASQEFVTGSPILVKGTVVDGANVEVSIAGSAPVTAALAAPAAGRRAWTAELTAPAVGSHNIVATLDNGPETASVTVSVTALRASGRWDGEFAVYDGTPERNQVTGGSMVILYNSDWFRMYFGALEVTGTTDNWDLIDKEGFRIVGTYLPVGATNRWGAVLTEEWVEFDAVLGTGQIIEGFATRD